MVKKKVKIIEIKKDIKVKEEPKTIKELPITPSHKPITKKSAINRRKPLPRQIPQAIKPIAKIPEIKRPLKNLSEIVQEGEPIPSVPVQKEEETRVQEKKEKLSINYEIKSNYASSNYAQKNEKSYALSREVFSQKEVFIEGNKTSSGLGTLRSQRDIAGGRGDVFVASSKGTDLRSSYQEKDNYQPHYQHETIDAEKKDDKKRRRDMF